MDVNRQRYWLRLAIAVLIAAAGVVPASAHQARPRPPRSTTCLSYEVVQRTYEGDYDRALALSEECAEAHLRLVNPHGLVLDSANPSALQSALSAQWALAFLCATAQLQALTGARDSAEITVQRAEAFLTTWPGFNSFRIATTAFRELLAATRGFIAERAGQIPASIQAYQRAGEVGASRLAVIALSQGDDGHAAAFAVTAGANATALAVQGSIAELRGDAYGAFYLYYASEQQMRRMIEPYPTSAALPWGSGPTGPRPHGMSNPSIWDYQPMLLAERPRVIKALAIGPTMAPTTARPLPIIIDGQRAFNTWLESERAHPTPGIAFRPQYPRFFAGFTRDDRDLIRRRKMAPPSGYDAAAVLVLPTSIEVTGLLDRDTLALDFYKLAAEVLSLAARARVAPADLLSPTEPEGLSPERRIVANELRAALTDLQTLHARLQSVELTTKDGALLTAADEVKLKSWTADVSTAHMTDLTPEFAESVNNITAKVREHLASAQRFLPAQ